MKNRDSSLVAAIATVLVLSTIATPSMAPENASAYEKNQATSQGNDCGNGEISTNVGCQNTDSQIQGDENVVTVTAQQTFPEEPKPTPMTATLQVCRQGGGSQGNTFSITGNNPSPSQLVLTHDGPSLVCQDVVIGPGTYLIDGPLSVLGVAIAGDCERDPNNIDNAIGEIQSGETQTCRFIYF